jgi:septal ring factor EnvC (AmiA/AmiB activator)
MYGNSVDKKIETTKSTLQNTKNRILIMNKKLDKIAQQIYKQTIYLNNINTQIALLNQKILDLENILKNTKESVTSLEYKKMKLLKKRKIFQKELIDFISKNYYIKNRNITSFRDVINEEILKVVAKQSSKKLDKIYKSYTNIDTEIANINNKIKEIKEAKSILLNRKEQMAQLKKQKSQNLLQLNKIKLSYKTELQKVIASQNRLQEQLAKLNIIKEKLKQEKLNKKREQKIEKIKIKNYANIYMRPKTARYRGKKTIPPLNGVIVKHFGAYTDPIYNISLYNDSITIKPPKTPAKVRAIMNGKVVFVGESNEGKIIVIQHKNKLHSIYAKLDRISPFVKKGYRVKKSEVIAKVDKELEFEVTYKTLPINPKEVVNF